MKTEIDFLGTHPKANRDYDARERQKTPEDIAIARRFGKEFFDGPRSQGYGGYHYDGRWKAVAARMIDHYRLGPDAAIFDVGCAKGFLLNDFKELLPHCMIAGIDVSEYAILNALESVRPRLQTASADQLPYPDKSFDLVISINSIHNLPPDRCKQALREIQRVSRGHAFVTVDAWRTDEERRRLLQWILTAQTYMSVEDWLKVFREVGYTGDYHWFIAD